MRASIFKRAEYKQWVGPINTTPVRPYVCSDPVHGCSFCIILVGSAIDASPGNEVLWGVAIIPSFQHSVPLVNQPEIFFFVNNGLPLKRAVQASKGGTPAATAEMLSVTGVSNSINLLAFLGRYLLLRPRWMLAAVQSPIGGGGEFGA